MKKKPNNLRGKQLNKLEFDETPDSIKEQLFKAADQITIYNQTHNGILDNPLDDLYIAIKSLPDKQIDLDSVVEKFLWCIASNEKHMKPRLHIRLKQILIEHFTDRKAVERKCSNCLKISRGYFMCDCCVLEITNENSKLKQILLDAGIK